MSKNDPITGQKNKFQEIVDAVKKHFSKKHKEDSLFADDEDEQLTSEEKDELNPETPIGGASMLDGEHGKIFGVSRPVVMGIGIFIFVVFSLAIIFATDDGSETATNTPQQKSESSINKTNRNQNGDLPSDYESLSKMDPSKKGQQTTGTRPNAQQPASVQATRNASTTPAQQAVSQPSSTVVPRVTSVASPPSYSQPYQIPSSVAATPASAAAPQQASSSSSESTTQKIEDKFRSAIAFALGGGSTVDSGSDSSSTGDGGDASSAPASASSSAPAAQTVASNTYIESSPTTLTAGTVIPAMLLTGINTDVQGQVKAQVMADVYDYSGTNLIIPAGSQVLGTYNANTGSSSNGRVEVNFSTIVMPDGGAWNIGNSITAIDGGGYMGLAGNVHRHTGSNFMKGIMNSALTALSTVAVDRVTLDMSSLNNLTNTNSQVTVTVDPGYQFNLYVANSITF